MDKYIILLTIIGLAGAGMAWMPALTKRTGISYSILYVLVGIVIYLGFPAYLPSPIPSQHEAITVHLTELTIIISLMGTGIKIDRRFSVKNWATPLKLATLAMMGCIAGGAALGYYWLGFDLPSALLLGAILAPTDPVLAADVQVEPPNEGGKSETKFALTAEAGMNDGMAFPFTWLAVTVALIANGNDASLLHWFGYDLVYKILAGLAIGFLLGRLAGYLIFSLSQKISFLKTNDGFLALSLTLLVYGATELVHGYGFIAVFVSAVTLRHYEKDHDYHETLHSVTEQAERLLTAIVLILFGGALVKGILVPLTWQMAVFAVLFLFAIRPVAAFASIFPGKFHIKEKLAISFFGIRGLGTIFYLSFALQQTFFDKEKELWAIAAFTILLSIVLHGITAGRTIKHLKKELPPEPVPE